MTYSSSSPVVTTTSIWHHLCFNKHRLTQVHLENGRYNGEGERVRWYSTALSSSGNFYFLFNHSQDFAIIFHDPRICRYF